MPLCKQQSRRLVVWLSIVALLQLTLMSWVPGVMGSQGLSWLETCSAQGVRAVLVQDADSNDTLPTPRSNEHCPLCSKHEPVLDALMLASILLLVPPQQGQQLVPARPLVPRANFAWRPHTARAPPEISASL